MSEILASYLNGNNTVTIYTDGTKERIIVDSFNKFPESVDCKITNWCDAGCSYCHESSTRKGLHGDLEPIIKFFTQLPKGVEIAIGGGHPLSHPEFEYFVKELSNAGIICNVTINEKHFNKELLRLIKLIENKHIYGVGYSYSSNVCEYQYEHLVNHVIIGITPFSELENIIKYNDKVLLLGYKFNTGRGLKYSNKPINNSKIRDNINEWYRHLHLAVKMCNISFDNLAISQLNPSRLLLDQEDYNEFYMGKDGEHTMYIDAVSQTYSISSTDHNKYKLSDTNYSPFETFAHISSLVNG